MELKEIEITQIKQNEWNPNVMPEHLFRILVENIKAGGMQQPILVRKIEGKIPYEIVDGAHRWKASREVGLTKIWCVVSESDEETSKLKTISFNKLRGISDEQKMKELLEDLMKELDASEIVSQTGLTQLEVEKYLGNVISGGEIDLAGIKDPKEIEEYFIRQGFSPEKAKAMSELYAYQPAKLGKTDIVGDIKDSKIMIAFYTEDVDEAKELVHFFKDEGSKELNTKRLLNLVRKNVN